MTPQVGSKITVVCKAHNHKSVFLPLANEWTSTGPETNTYTGQVVKSDAWMRTDEFNLTTDNPRFPIRTIHMDNVLTINGADKKDVTVDVVEQKTITGSKGNEYVITLKNGVAETCTCPAFMYRGGRCKHLSLASGVATTEKSAAVAPAAKPAAKVAVVKAAKVTKLQHAKQIYVQLKGDRKSTIEALKRTLKMTDAGASTYYYLCKKG